MTGNLNKPLRTGAGAMLAAGILAGCANTPADLNPGTAAKLQDRLQTLARSAADNDFPAARTELDLLAGDVSAAAANGELSAGRRQDIQNAIDLIRADLIAATPATVVPTPVPSPPPAVQAPAPAQVPAVQAPAPVPAIQPPAPAPALQKPPPAVPQAPAGGEGDAKGEGRNAED
ncbi:MAG: hypothetical protein NVS2B15_17710 [Pseudarthrobacter sp.]